MGFVLNSLHPSKHSSWRDKQEISHLEMRNNVLNKESVEANRWCLATIIKSFYEIEYVKSETNEVNR